MAVTGQPIQTDPAGPWRGRGAILACLDRLVHPLDHLWPDSLRFWLSGCMDGRILELGAGTGRNLPFYPAHCQVLALDPSERCLRRAENRARQAACRAELARGGPGDLAGLAESSFDLSLCAFLMSRLRPGAQVRLLKDLMRVTKPRGVVRLVDYQGPAARSGFSRTALDLYLRLGLGVRHGRFIPAAIRECQASILWKGSWDDDLFLIYDLLVPEPAGEEAWGAA